MKPWGCVSPGEPCRSAAPSLPSTPRFSPLPSLPIWGLGECRCEANTHGSSHAALCLVPDALSSRGYEVLAVVRELVGGCPPQGPGADLCFGGSSQLLCLARACQTGSGLASGRGCLSSHRGQKPSILGGAWGSGGFLDHRLIHESRSSRPLATVGEDQGRRHPHCRGHSLLAALGSQPCPVCLWTPDLAHVGSCPSLPSDEEALVQGFWLPVFLTLAPKPVETLMLQIL